MEQYTPYRRLFSRSFRYFLYTATKSEKHQMDIFNGCAEGKLLNYEA